ncbi:MAG TPA: LacI family DNA-binding transcriptional regulator [bacterium]|nr:LacI family DNA-binding transcriptional regulator [bacterium]
MRRVNIQEVAKEAGVSPSTVSRALNGFPGISEKTRERIVEIARKLNYRPNYRGQILTTQNTKNIGLLITDITNPFFPELVMGAEEYASKSGYTVLLGNTSESEEKETNYLDFFSRGPVDGIIISASRVSNEHIIMLAEEGLPIVVINRILEHPKISYVSTDMEKGGYLATMHLLRLGHSKIAFINGPKHSEVSQRRLEGYKKALKEVGVDYNPDLISFNVPVSESGYKEAIKLLCTGEAPTAIFTYNDVMAFGVIKAAKELGIKIPEELSVVGFDDIFFSSFTDPPLTTIKQFKEELGRMAVELLFKLMEGERESLLIEPELIIRNTTSRR